jgi:hypothetical protein
MPSAKPLIIISYAHLAESDPSEGPAQGKIRWLSFLIKFLQPGVKAKRLGSIRLWRFVHCTRRRAISGRSRSLATMVFFEAELLGVNEIAHRPIARLKAPIGELGDPSAQSKGALVDAPRQKPSLLASTRLGLTPADLARRDAPRFPNAPHPIDHCTRRNPKSPRRLRPRQPVSQNCRHRALTNIHRIRLAHPCWPPAQSAR